MRNLPGGINASFIPIEFFSHEVLFPMALAHASCAACALLVPNISTGDNGRILESLGLDGEYRRDASCLAEEFFGTSGFGPGAESNHGFGVIAEPVDGVAFHA